MRREGDVLPGDVIVATHICPDAPTKPHLPVDFMDSPVSIEEMNEREVIAEMAAVLSIDTTKGNRVLNTRGFAHLADGEGRLDPEGGARPAAARG